MRSPSPNADVFGSAAEYDFWTDATHAAAAPAAMKPFFEMARMVLRPYRSRLRLALRTVKR
jgi:hypothetical protein